MRSSSLQSKSRLRKIFTVVLALFSCKLANVLVAAETSETKGKPKPIEIANLQRDIPVDFQTEILPLLAKHCLACHSKAKSEGGLVLESPESILQGGDSGPAVTPGNWNSSLLLSLASHRQEPIMPPPGNEVNANPLSPDQLGLVRLWIDQGAKGQLFKAKTSVNWQAVSPSFQPTLAIAISRDGQHAAASRGNRVDVYHLPSKSLAASLIDPTLSADKPTAKTTHRDLVQSLAIDPTGQWIASGGYQEIKIWKRSEVLKAAESASPAGKNPEGTKANSEAVTWLLDRTIGGDSSPTPLADRILSLDFSPDGQLLAAAGGSPSRSGEVTIWNLSDGKLVQKIPAAHSDTILSVRFSPDGKTLATAGADRLAKLFDVSNAKLLRSLAGHTHHVLSVAWKKDGTTLATAGADGVIKTWNPQEETARRTIRALEKEAASIAFLSDSFRTITACGDRTIRIHNVDNGGTLRTINVPVTYLHCLAATPDGKQILAGSDDGKIRIWSADSGQLLGTLEPPAK